MLDNASGRLWYRFLTAVHPTRTRLGRTNNVSEGSIRLRQASPPPVRQGWSLRQPGGSCSRVLNANVHEHRLFFVCPDSGFGDRDFNPINLEPIKERPPSLLNELHDTA